MGDQHGWRLVRDMLISLATVLLLIAISKWADDQHGWRLVRDMLISLATVLLLIAISKWADGHHF